MPVMIIFLAFVALLIWGNLSRKSPSHPLNKLKSANLFVPLCTMKSTAGDNFASGCAIAAGVPEPITPLTCGNAVLSCDHIGTIAHFPVDPPPLAIQRTAKPILDTPVSSPIFPVSVGYHNNVVKSTNTVLLRQTQPTSKRVNAVVTKNAAQQKMINRFGIYVDCQGRYHIGSIGVGGRFIPKIGCELDPAQKTGINYTA